MGVNHITEQVKTVIELLTDWVGETGWLWGDEGTPGTASVVLPRRNGPAVPCPFDPGALGQATA